MSRRAFNALEVFAVFVLLALCSKAVVAENLDLQERKRWVREKVVAINSYMREYQKVLDEVSAAADAIAPQLLDTKPYRPRFEKIDTEMAIFIEHTNFDAQHRFKDNPQCQEGIDNFRDLLQKLHQHQIGVLEAGGNYASIVLMQCGLSPKASAMMQKLGKVKSEHPAKP